MLWSYGGKWIKTCGCESQSRLRYVGEVAQRALRYPQLWVFAAKRRLADLRGKALRVVGVEGERGELEFCLRRATVGRCARWHGISLRNFRCSARRGRCNGYRYRCTAVLGSSFLIEPIGVYDLRLKDDKPCLYRQAVFLIGLLRRGYWLVEEAGSGLGGEGDGSFEVGVGESG
jgi:hypothetical protein